MPVPKAAAHPSLLQRRLCILCLSLSALIHGSGQLRSAEWIIPLRGNAFQTAPAPSNWPGRSKAPRIDDSKARYKLFFHVDRACQLQLELTAAATTGQPSLHMVAANQSSVAQLSAGQDANLLSTSIEVTKAGYVPVEFWSTELDGNGAVRLSQFKVSSTTQSLRLDFVQSNAGNMFYWGRRGPSVHLRYRMPDQENLNLQYAYSEITVPEGQDPIGTFYMANGFGEGYFGFQVNSAQERRILFSVWSPFKTDNPQDIPPEQRVVLLARGPEVRVGEFGNEGSGGQSYLVYPWRAGQTYRFLTEVIPDGEGNTRYTAWFGAKSTGQWRLIASFKRPQTDTYLRRFHSFLESFLPAHGFQQRRAEYGDIWVIDDRGQWHSCDRALFSVDATGRKRQRMDYAGGATSQRFWLQNCGFFDASTKPGSEFSVDVDQAQPPVIEFDKLPRG